ncbi:hypothetical protein ACXDF8_16180 [Mycolicibacterium sp. CBM1]
MRLTIGYAFAIVIAAGGAAGVLAPQALADTTLIAPSVPNCVETGGSSVIGGNSTECGTPGNVQLNATPEVPEDFAYPWGDEFYGPALIFGAPGAGGGGGAHGGGGR